MKNVLLLLLGVCCLIPGLYAQKLESVSLDEAGESFEVRVKYFEK